MLVQICNKYVRVGFWVQLIAQIIHSQNEQLKSLTDKNGPVTLQTDITMATLSP